nr:MAG TPA: hypothetical protein [Caudoviricetes sp.]
MLLIKGKLMTTIALDTGLQDLFDTDAFKKNIQDKASKVVRKISSAVYDAMMVGSESLQFELDEKFDKKVSSANKELEAVNYVLFQLIQQYPSAYDGINHCINNVEVGSPKIDRDGRFAYQISFIKDVCLLTASQAKQAREQIDLSNIQRYVLLDSIIQLTLLEKYLKEIFTEVQEIGERIEIYDAMTESAIDVSQDPFLANLPGVAHA